MCLSPIFFSSRWAFSLKAGKSVLEHYQHSSSLTPSWAPKQVASLHIKTDDQYFPLCCLSLQHLRQLWEIMHNLCLLLI